MKRKFALVGNDGVVQYTASPADDATYRDVDKVNGLDVIEIPADAIDQEVIARWYRKGDEWRTRAPFPGPYWSWNAHSEEWQQDLAGARAAAKKFLNDRLMQDSFSPILVGDVLAAADRLSQDDVRGKLDVLQHVEPTDLPPLVWRDTNDVLHEWKDAVAYAAWLKKYLVAVSERNYSLRAATWAVKAQIDQAGTVEEILRLAGS